MALPVTQSLPRAPGPRLTLPTPAAPPAVRAISRKRALQSLQAARRLLAGSSGRSASEHTCFWLLPPEPSSVPRARRLARGRLADWGLDEQGEVTELLISELVTNAVRHTEGPLRLTLSARRGTLRCEIEDTHPALPLMCRADPHEDEGGRGLHMVDLLSRRWGCGRTAMGKVVWFEVSTAMPDRGTS
ncbi:ATP-binding protein [Wenjunlia tyrosinilytica]|uniref:Histidine kinase/HSP90-like ATPase domain-containing protein n=1 Tax=Wenjunlia tyrosinilytica TaxID=1544741 RepID=A0A917ZSV5_9ACTN|nr:ATP-binding protein [Wenjunlia tyrosinilytica]GGO90279.1 hypothetical protein GCM10012280_35440 [Wenjunlia tyrosinilytica]